MADIEAGGRHRGAIRPNRSIISSAYQPLPPPPKRTRICRRILTFVFNKKEGTIFGRTPLSWFCILLFYTVLYTILLGIMYLAILVIYIVKDKYNMLYTGEDSLQKYPALIMYPLTPDRTGFSVITWDQNSKHWKDIPFPKKLKNFLDRYSADHPSNAVDCSFTSPPKSGKFCKVNINDWGNCTLKDGKILHSCVYFSLGRVKDWKPKSYTVDDLPDDMPEGLSKIIKDTPEGKRNGMWLYCYAKMEGDKTKFTNFDYYPSNLFPSYYFPWDGDKTYKSPVIAVYIGHVTPDKKHKVFCQMWAKNIRHPDRYSQAIMDYSVIVKTV